MSVLWKGDWKLFPFHKACVPGGGRLNVTENKAAEWQYLADGIRETNNLAAIDMEELLDDRIKSQKKMDAPFPSQLFQKRKERENANATIYYFDRTPINKQSRRGGEPACHNDDSHQRTIRNENVLK